MTYEIVSDEVTIYRERVTTEIGTIENNSCCDDVVIICISASADEI